MLIGLVRTGRQTVLEYISDPRNRQSACSDQLPGRGAMSWIEIRPDRARTANLNVQDVHGCPVITPDSIV